MNIDDLHGYPPNEVITHPAVALSDARGEILNILTDSRIQHVALITSRAGSRRAAHFHPLQSEGHQWMYLISGTYRSRSVPVDAEGRPTGEVVEQIHIPGDLSYVAPGVGHEYFFDLDSVFLNLSATGREHEGYGKSHTMPLPGKLW